MCGMYQGGEKKKEKTVPKTGKKKERPRAELITHFRLLKSERVRERAGVPIDTNIDLYACGEADRGRRNKSLFRIAEMNIYDRARAASAEKKTRL